MICHGDYSWISSILFYTVQITVKNKICLTIIWITVKTFLPYLYYSRLSLSRIPRDSLKYFEIAVPRHVRFAEFRKKTNRTATFNKCICNLTPEVRDIFKIL